MSTTLVSHNTPSLMAAETLEAIFVRRQALAQRLVERVVESATTRAKRHALLIGPPGIGKTHLISLLYHRMTGWQELRRRLAIAWLREEEYRISSYFDLLLAIVECVWQQDGSQSPAEYESLFDLPDQERETAAARLLLRTVGDRTLLLLAENFNEILEGLAQDGQAKLLALIQTYPLFLVVATSPRPLEAATPQQSACRDLFEITNLPPFSADDAAEMLRRIAKLRGQDDLLEFLSEPKGRARVRALHHLAGGNPRFFAILSQFLQADSLDSLVDAALNTIDDLTLYYQSLLRELSPQQRKIIEYLCRRQRAEPVSEIARKNLISSQTASSQLKKLTDHGYVQSETVGRESFYQPREPLLKVALDIKRNRGRSVQILLGFLRIWFSSEALPDRLEAPQPAGGRTGRAYPGQALDLSATERPTRFDEALRLADELIASSGASGWVDKGIAFSVAERYQEALDSFDRALELDPGFAPAWYNRGVDLGNVGRDEEALESFDRALGLDARDESAWYNRGNALGNLGRCTEALASYDRALELDALDASAWYHRGNALRTLRRNEEALDSYDRALQIDPRRESAWSTRGAVLESLGRYEDALRSYDRALEIDPRDASVWSSRGAALGELGRYHEGISALREALKLERTAPRALCLAQLAYVAGAPDSAREEAAWVIDNAGDAHIDASARFLAACLVIQSDVASSKRLLDETAQRAVADDARPELRPLAARAAVDGSWEALADRLSDWLNAFNHHGGVANLAAAVVDSIARLRAPALRWAAERWRETWQTVARDEDEMAPALRMLDSAVRYLETGDRRALLELPQEERLIVEPLVGFRAEQ